MAITKIILQQMVTMDQNSVTASKYPKYTIVLGNTISSITAAELTSAIESSKASAAAAKQSEINAKQSELNAKDSENEAEISAASSQQSATQSASSATASANSAKAAKTSETNAKASETAAKTSETKAKASETAAKTSETNANSSKAAAAASASAAKTSETNAAASASAAKTSETNANSSKTAAANSASAAKTSETNAKTSETNAAASATKAENAASGMRDSIGLGNAPRNCPDISGNPSAYIGFMRIMSTAVGFPSIASGESSLTGFISQVDGTPAYTGVFQGWASRSLYTYRWNPTIGPEWTRHTRKNEVDKLVQLSSETQLLNPGNNAKIIITSNKLWGAYDIENRTYIPLAVGQGGTGGRSAAEARNNLQINRFQRSSDTRTIILSTDVQKDGCYLQVDADGQWGAFNPKTSRWQPLAIPQGGTGANDTSTARTNLQVMYEAKTGLDGNTNLNDIKGTTAGFYYQPMSANAKPELNYPIQLAGALRVLKDGANIGYSCIQTYYVYNNPRISYSRVYNGGSDTWSDWVRSVSTGRIEEGESTTYVYSDYSPLAPRLQVGTSGLWGCHNGSSWVPLSIGQGGTGATTLQDAKTNLQIPEGGLTKAMTLQAPAGAEDGKYYPVIIDASAIEGNGNLTCPVDIKTAGRAASDPMNSSTFSGYFRCGSWSDTLDIACGSFVAYDKNELGILCLKASRKDYPQYVAFYIHKSAFPILLQTCYKARVIVPTEDYVIGKSGVKYKFGVSTSEEGNNDNAVKNVLDFTGGESGFYSNLPFRERYSNNVALTNGLSFDKNFTFTTPIFVNNGQIKATQSFTAYGTDVPNRSFVSQRLQSEGGPVVDQTELRAANGSGEIVVRDVNNSGNSKWFTFSLNGTFDAYHGLTLRTGHNWAIQHTDNVNKFKPIAGSAGGPDGTMVVGGFHAQFSGNYATQFAGRNSKFWVRSIEAGESKEWLKLITATLAPKIPTDARDGFISDSDGNTLWAPSNGGGFQSSYAENRIVQSWVDNVGRLYGRFLTTNQPTTSKTVVPWKSAAMLELDNRFTGNNTFTGALVSTGDITCARVFSKGALQTESGGIELYHSTPYIDFHFNKATSDYTARIINDVADQLTFVCQSVRTVPFEDPSASNGQIRFAPKFQSQFNSVGSNSSGAARMAMWFEEHVGNNHRGVIEVTGYGAPAQYWHFRRDGSIWNSVRGEVTWGGTSDLRYKDNVVAYDGLQSLENIKAMNLIKFTYKDDDRKRERRGVAAQQIMEIDPCYVKKSEGSYIDANGEQVNIEKLVLDTNPLLMDALCAIKVLSAQVGELKEENAELHANTASREEQITALESEVSDLKKQIADLTLVVNSLLANRA